MYLHIETHLDLSSDILFDIGTQIDNGALSGKTPYLWKIMEDGDDDLNVISKDLKRAFTDEINDLDLALQRIKDHLEYSFTSR